MHTLVFTLKLSKHSSTSDEGLTKQEAKGI